MTTSIVYWIDVDRGLPADDEDVLIRDARGRVSCGSYNSKRAKTRFGAWAILALWKRGTQIVAWAALPTGRKNVVNS
jgi:hypothetical protein